MNRHALFFVFAVSILNIALNVSIRKVANAPNLVEALLSAHFAKSFGIGTLSVLCLVLFYSTGVSLARGVLLMGAISIIGGSIYGVIVHEDRLTNIEYSLLAVIGLLFTYRFVRTF